MSSPKKRIVLVTGCPRSGTTALLHLLNCHPQMAVSHERYSTRIASEDFGPDLFDLERFRTFQEGDCHIKAFDTAETQYALAKAENAIVIGDKVPDPKLVFDAAERVEGAMVIAILREPSGVARSYDARCRQTQQFGEKASLWPTWRDHKAATTDFNNALGEIKAGIERSKNGNVPVLVLDYGAVFSGAYDINEVFRFVGLDPSLAEGTEDIVNARARERVNLDLIDQYVAENANYSGYRQLLDHSRQQGARSAT